MEEKALFSERKYNGDIRAVASFISTIGPLYFDVDIGYIRKRISIMRVLNMKTREDKQFFYQSKEWRTLRNYKKATHPLCELHLKKGILKPATEVHHIIDIDEVPTIENALDYDNLMSLCKSCHSKITSQKKRPTWSPFNLKEFKRQNI